MEGTPIPKLTMVKQSKVYTEIRHKNKHQKSNLKEPRGTSRKQSYHISVQQILIESFYLIKT
jgi:hypothetical protein